MLKYLWIPLLCQGISWSGVEGDLDSLTLQKALDLVFEHHPGLTAGQSAVSAKSAAQEQAAKGQNPTLGIEMEDFAGTGEFSGVNAVQTTVQLSQSVELGSKRNRRKQLATAEMKLAETDLEKKRLDLHAKTHANFLAALALQKRFIFTQESYQLALRLQETVTRRVKEGAASMADEIRSRLAVSESKMEMGQDSIRLASAKRKLALLWGEKVKLIPALRGAMDSMRREPTLEALSQVIAQCPDAALKANMVRVAEARLQAQKSLASPDLNFSAGIRHAAAPGDVALLAGISIPMPLRNRNQGGQAEAKHEVTRAQAEEKVAILELKAFAEEIHQQLSSARLEVESLQQNLLPDAEKAVQVLEEGYRRGRFGMLDVLNAEADLFRLRLRYLNALLQYQLGYVELEKIMGHGAENQTQPNQNSGRGE